MTDRRSFLKGLLSSIGGIMIVKPPSLNEVIKEPEAPKPPEQPQVGFYSGSSFSYGGVFKPSDTEEPADGYVGMHPTYPYSDDIPMADPFPSEYLTEQTSPEEEKRIRRARREWQERNND